MSRFREDPRTWANLVTVIRVVAGVVVFGVAAHERDERLNYFGLGLFWVLDILDGFLARSLKQETRLGAQFDILADRLLVAFFYLNFVAMHAEFVVPVVLFLLQFNLIDHYLSNQFIRWPVASPNYFYVVDRNIWRLNWSVPAKALNSQFGPLIMIFTGSIWLASAVSLAIIGLKVYSCVLLHRLPPPEDAWDSIEAPAPARGDG